MSAWVDDEGSPSHQVIRFHKMAPISAENTITRPWLPEPAEMIPWPTVAATLVEISAPTTLNPAAITRAVPGRIALVAIDAATAFAASWNPLVKSNPSATTMKRIRPAVPTARAWHAGHVAAQLDQRPDRRQVPSGEPHRM